MVTPLTGGEKRIQRIELTDIPLRPARTSRIRMKVSMTSAERIVIHIEDMGFGELYESSGLSWTEEVKV
jgi:hypothetical protein